MCIHRSFSCISRKSVQKALLAASFLLPAPSLALAWNDGIDKDTAAKKVSGNNEYEYVVSGTVVSEYVARGFSATRGHPAIQAEADLIIGAFYAGVWTSTLDYGRQAPRVADGGHTPSPDVEGDFYLGYQRKFGQINVETNATYVAYIGAGQEGARLDYVELKAGAETEIARNSTFGAAVFYSPNYYDHTGQNWIFEFSTKRELPKFGIFTPTLNGSISYQAGDKDAGGFNYWFYDAGVSFAFHEHYKVDFRYHDTINVPFDCERLCGSRLVASLKAEF
jgi:uncharacterized protein (TIGR02001 family)